MIRGRRAKGVLRFTIDRRLTVAGVFTESDASMKNLIHVRALIVIAGLAAGLAAQKPAKPVFEPPVSASGEILFSPSLKNPVYWEKENACCRTAVIDGVGYRTIVHGDKIIIFGLTRLGKYYTADVMVGNLDKEGDFLFDPSLASYDWTKEAGDTVDFKLFKTEKAKSPDKIASALERNTRISNALASMGTSFSYPNSQLAQLRTDINNAVKNARTAQTADTIRDVGFRANTIFPGSWKSGTIFFKKNEYRQAFFIFPIGDVQYVFAITNAKK